MMRTFKTQTEAEAEVARLDTEVLRIAELEKQVTQVIGERDTAVATSGTLQTKLEQALKANEEIEASVEKRASMRAQEIVASMGAPPVKAQEPTITGSTDLRAQFNDLVRAGKAQEAAEFFAKNKSKMYN